MEKKVITITNEKGGVGKTTTTIEMAAALIKKGFKVLAVDLDPQCNLSFATKADKYTNMPNVANFILGETGPEDSIIKLQSGLHIIQGSGILSSEISRISPYEQIFVLSEKLETIDDYDYIILDTPPIVSPITSTALEAATNIIIPVQAEEFSLKGATTLTQEILKIKKRKDKAHEKYEISGILICRFKRNLALSKVMLTQFEKFATALNTKVFETKIREAIAIQESQLARKSVTEMDPKSVVAEDYLKFVEEYLRG